MVKTEKYEMLMGKKMKLPTIEKHLSKCLLMEVRKAPLMMWRWFDAPNDLLILLGRKKLYRKAVKKRDEPQYIELFFYGQGMDGPEDIYGCCIDSSLTDTKITDGYTSSWEFKFPKKGFSIVAHWLG